MSKAKGEPAADDRQSQVVASVVANDGTIVELIRTSGTDRTALAVWRDGNCQVRNEWTIDGVRLVPYSSNNNLIRHGALLLPGEPVEYDGEAALLAELRAYIHRYVDVSTAFEQVALYYVLLSWLHDAFNELPYLRLRGDYGSGKTRCLLIIGAVCYRPFFASGASTVSPIFHTLDAFHGTLVMDEGDFRFSDEKAEISKILNNGNVRGMPVLRAVAGEKGEYDARAFQVFGPKLIATRGHYDDRALESRFLTEELGGREIRADIPLNLPSAYQDEARRLRSQLLLYRFRNLHLVHLVPDFLDAAIEPRLKQIFLPLVSVVSDETARQELLRTARQFQAELVAERAMETEAALLEVIRDLAGKNDATVPLKDIAVEFVRRHGSSLEQRVTSRWVGTTVRRALGMRTHKSHGNFVVDLPGKDRLLLLLRRFGLEAPADGEGSDAAGT